MIELDPRFLQQVALFGALEHGALEILLDAAGLVECRRGAGVFQEGDSADALYIVVEGRVAVVKKWGGRQYLLRHLDVGDCLGEMALVDMQPRSASVIAVEPSSLLCIKSAEIHDLHRSYPEQFTLLQMNLGREISRRLREADERMFRWRIGNDAPAPMPYFEAPVS